MTRASTTNIAAIAGIAALFMFGIVSMMPRASAVTGIICLDKTPPKVGDVTDVAPLNLNDVVNCTATTSHLGIVASTMTVFPPSGPSTVVATNSGVGSNAINSGDVTVNQPGVWTVEADFFDANGVRTQTELINISVSFLVIPESPIGVAALIGTSLVALGAYMGVRRFRASAQPSLKI